MWLLALLAIIVSNTAAMANDATSPDFNAKILPVFTKYCTGCHNAKDREGKLVLETYADLLRGGKRGAEFVANHPENSRLLRVLTGDTQPSMPPKDNDAPKPEEIALLRAWIEAGAKGPSGASPDPTVLVIPKHAPTAPVRRAIQAVACSPDGRWIAVARYGAVELLAAETRAVVRTFGDLPGQVNDVAFSADSAQLVAATGQAGLFGEARLWNVADGRLVRTFRGHRDSLYAVALSPDGRTLATGSYDQQIMLWNVATGARTAHAHRAQRGRLRAGLSARRPVARQRQRRPDRQALGHHDRPAAGNVRPAPRRPIHRGLQPRRHAVGRRRGGPPDSHLENQRHGQGRNQSTIDGAIRRRAAAGEADLFARWAHAGHIERRSADQILERRHARVGSQAGSPARRGFRVGLPAQDRRARGRTDGRIACSLRCFQRKADRLDRPLDRAARIGLRANFVATRQRTALAAAVPLLAAIDPIPEQTESEPNDTPAQANLLKKLPVIVKGSLGAPGDADYFSFDAAAGQTLVFDVEARRNGSPAQTRLALFDASGKLLNDQSEFDPASDPLLAYTFTKSGRYLLRLDDRTLAGGPKNTYRLTIGALPYVVGLLSAQHRGPHGDGCGVDRFQSAGERQSARAGRFARRNDGPARRETVSLTRAAEGVGERFARAVGRRAARASRTTRPLGPRPCRPRAAPTGGSIAGHRAMPAECRLLSLRVESRAAAGSSKPKRPGAARRSTRGSMCSRPMAAPFPACLLQAVRDSFINFRGIDSEKGQPRLKNYEEMELNQYIYMRGEVCKLFQYPQGPDSDFFLYRDLGGKRRTYFDTTSTTHANFEPVFVVVAPSAGREARRQWSAGVRGRLHERRRQRPEPWPRFVADASPRRRTGAIWFACATAADKGGRDFFIG